MSASGGKHSGVENASKKIDYVLLAAACSTFAMLLVPWTALEGSDTQLTSFWGTVPALGTVVRMVTRNSSATLYESCGRDFAGGYDKSWRVG